jgi:hypothetical protein
MPLDSSTYIKLKKCCNYRSIQGPQGPQGIPGKGFDLSGEGLGNILLYNTSNQGYYYNNALEIVLDASNNHQIDISGSVIPTNNNIYTLGSETLRWKDLFIGPGTINISSPGGLQDATLGSDSQGIAYTEFGFATPFISIGPSQLTPQATGGWKVQPEGTQGTSDYELSIQEIDTSGVPVDPKYSLLRGGKLEKVNSILMFQDISSTTEYQSLIYDQTKTQNNGFENFLNVSNQITFSNIKDISGLVMEFYLHCNAKQGSGSGGQDNYVIFDLSSTNVSSINGLQIVDIDTRSVDRGELAHLSFGPFSYRIIDGPTVDQNECIDSNNTFVLQVTSGKSFNIYNPKLVMKGFYYS